MRRGSGSAGEILEDQSPSVGIDDDRDVFENHDRMWPVWGLAEIGVIGRIVPRITLRAQKVLQLSPDLPSALSTPSPATVLSGPFDAQPARNR